MKAPYEKIFCGLVGCAIQILPHFMETTKVDLLRKISKEVCPDNADTVESFVRSLQTDLYGKNRSISAKKALEILPAAHTIIDTNIADNSDSLPDEKRMILENMKSVVSVQTPFEDMSEFYRQLFCVFLSDLEAENNAGSTDFLLFLYRISKNFRAACEIDNQDFFLIHYLAIGDRAVLKKEMDCFLGYPPTNVYSFLTEKNGNPWLTARKDYLSNEMPKARPNFQEFCQKLEEYRRSNDFVNCFDPIRELKNIYLIFFLYLISHKNNRINFWFGLSEIDILLPFKYCLQQKEKSELLSRLDF